MTRGLSPLRRLARRLARLLRRRRVTVPMGPGDGGGTGPPEAGVREPRRPKPSPPAGAVALPDPEDPART